jgi:hypothetical protein
MDAIAWGKETAGYAEKKFGVSKIDVWVDAFGAAGTMRWSFDAPDLAAVEKIQQQMMMDPGYWQLVDKAYKNGLFIDGTSNDVVSRSV